MMRTITLEEHYASEAFLEGPGRKLKEQAERFGGRAAKLFEQLCERLAAGSRGHWGVESMHWVLDVEFKDDLSRYRAGHGAKNMAVVRRFALGLLRANKSKGSIKTRRKSASWNTQFLLEILQMK